MGTILVNNAGSATFAGKVTDITVQSDTKNAVIRTYGADKDVVQKMGLANRVFTVEGFVTSSADVIFLNNALNFTGSIYYSSSALNMELIGTANAYVYVLYRKLIWKDEGATPMMRTFSLELIEVKP